MTPSMQYMRAGFFAGLALTVVSAFGANDGGGAKRPPVTMACSISVPSSDVTITVGSSLSYTGQVSGGRGPYVYTWTFPEGNPSSRTNSTRNKQDSVAVSYAKAGVLTTTLAVVDRANNNCAASRKVTVTAASNSSPVITSNGGGASAAISVAENTTAVTTVTATDVDLPAQTLTYSISAGADATKFAINSSTGVLRFVTAPDYEVPTDVGANNVYDVAVQVSDGSLADTQAIAVTVSAVNDNTPVITSNGGGASAAISVAENTTDVTTVTATDADLPAQTLTFSLTGGADSAKFSINSGTGALRFVTAPSYQMPTDVGADNVYNVTVQVSDGSLTNAQAIAVTVTAATQGAGKSINSTSVNRATFPSSAVAEQTFATLSGYQVLVANDLGMHCGDLDHRVASILPLFNVLHAQVIRKGGSDASILNPTQVSVVYSAASNPNDPALASAAVAPIFKTNIWDYNLRRNTGHTLIFDGYDPFYPVGILGLFPLGADTGLPVPDLDLLYPASGASQLAADQQLMPGNISPYSANVPQVFKRFDTRLPFFINFPFGYTLNDVNWFAADGIPVTTVDDAGRQNPYPLMRVQAMAAAGNALGISAGTVLASLDTVTPVSGEADCHNCHTSEMDDGNGLATQALADANIPVATLIDDPDISMPMSVSLEYAADLNILRLHDLKHGPGSANPRYTTKLEDQTPVVCQRCHYTPALDLAQVGPEDTNGREHTRNQTMSRVMHGFHGELKRADGSAVFPAMPGPVGRSYATKESVLSETCYQCHPGKNTRCLRGAMGSAGVVCQDCHGNMTQVGNDFSKNVSPDNVGAFVLDASLRVPWANEPGCQSCHTGDALSNLSGTANVIKADDGIRLLQAFHSNDSDAKPIVATNRRFAENENSGNQVLYRLSKGHGGVFCEGCHGSTHAEWPNANPNSNDNMAAKQLQGHTGTLIECVACHTQNSLPLNLNGPHGMHPVNDARWVSQHKDLVHPENLNTCLTCHGSTMDGTVLSRMAETRTFSVEDHGMVTLAKGTQVGCANCHGKPFR